MPTRNYNVGQFQGAEEIIGATIAFAMACFERGVIDHQQTGGLRLCFGDTQAVLETLRQSET